MKKTFPLLLVIGISAALAFALGRAPISSQQSGAKGLILVGSRADAHVVSTIERNCQNCHSSNTEWPVYSRIFPISLMIQHDVQTARSHMDLSEWQTYSDSEKSRILSEIGSVVRNRIMPPGRYTMLHRDAKLSPIEVNEIYQWTRSERRLLNRAQGE
jgi:hypothetical protein